MPSKNKSAKNFNFEKLLSVNSLLVIIILLELLVAFYLIISQNYQLKAIYKNSLESLKNDSLLVTKESNSPQASVSATLTLISDQSYKVNEPVEIEIELSVDKPETVSAVEGHLKYDPEYIKVENLITRSLFKKAKDLDSPSKNTYSFALYNQDGQKIEHSLGLATITLTPLKVGETSLELFFEEGNTVGNSAVMRFENPVNLLHKTNKLDIVIK